jgi:hypothetical protein
MTRSFGAIFGSDQGTEFSPFQSGFTLFPFLLVEAKSEKGGNGFAAILRQSFLPLRTCLKLQMGIAKEKGDLALPPLVWFIGFQGPDWRLYATIPDGENTVSSMQSCHVWTDDSRMSSTAGMDISKMKMKPCSC